MQVPSYQVRKHTETNDSESVCLYLCFFDCQGSACGTSSSLTTGAFVATLRRFIGRRGLPTLIWSNHGTNFVGAKCELIDLYKFLAQEYHQEMITDFFHLTEY